MLHRQSASPRVVLVQDPAAAARLVVDEIEDLCARCRAEGRAPVLGLSTGRTPVAIYGELIRRVREGGLDLGRAVAFNLDEYEGLSSSDPRSFAAWMERVLFDPLEWPRSRRHIPDGTVCPADQGAQGAAYEAAIRAAGGIDLQLLGIGRNGHIGFNEPGSDLHSRTRVVELDRSTREDAAADFFPEDPPRRAITMGIATICEARRVRLLAFGAHKRAAIQRALSGPLGEDCPASFLALHPDARFLLDGAAHGPGAQS